MRQVNNVKRIVFAGTSVLYMCTSSQAADAVTGPTLDEATSVYDWSGFYAGVHGGYAWGDASSPPAPTQHPDGGFGGIGIGYDHQFTNNLLLGVVADISLANVGATFMDGNFLRFSGEVDYFGTVRGRAGYAFNRFLPYVTAGFAWSHSEFSASCPAGATAGVCVALGEFSNSDDTITTGWTAGVGLDYAFRDNWSVGIEYLYADFGKDTYTVNPLPASEVESDLNLVRIGIDYRF